VSIVMTRNQEEGRVVPGSPAISFNSRAMRSRHKVTSTRCFTNQALIPTRDRDWVSVVGSAVESWNFCGPRPASLLDFLAVQSDLDGAMTEGT